MTGLPSRSEGKHGKDSLGKGGKVAEESLVFGKYSDAELIAQLKGLALDPCSSQFSRTKIRPLWNQTIRLRNAMSLTDDDFSRRKRRLQQFVRCKLKAHRGSASGVSSKQNHTKLERGQVSHASSASFLPNSCLFNPVVSAEIFDKKILSESNSLNSLLTYEDNFLDKQKMSESSFMADGMNWSSPSKDMSPLVDSDESVNCSNTLSPENLALLEVPSLNLDEIIDNSDSLVLDKPSQKHLHPPRRSIRLLNFIGDHLQRMVVPVGPRFQADVPEWTGLCRTEYGDSENLRWLGTRTWPLEVRNAKITAKPVGKGRPESCSCSSPASIECIKHHIREERLLLQCDLGPAFFSWKFDEMGEQVSKSWTLEEQKTFDSLARMKPLSNGKDFMKQTSKFFPNKCRKTIANYYFNVFIPRRLSLQTRLSSKQVDSDEDEVESCNYLGFQKKIEGRRTSVLGSPKDVKSRHLRRPI